ncbi:MAG TPA: transglutaminase-like domain-containing protein [Blastocatellia bacterium]|nr:transglutaminase-like domain-containing protein [Blastocatellia bacterium]
MQHQSASEARNRFAELVSLDDDQINLAEAALLIATEEYTRLKIEDYLDRLDRFGDIASERAEGASDASHVISAINSTLFAELGFHGNRDSYFDPRNSFLNQVIDRRTGIPITLTVVYMEVARRIGFQIRGVGLPYHFIAKHESETGDVFIDAFNEGRVLDTAGCAELLSEMTGGQEELQPEHLEPVSNKRMLARILLNLLGIYKGVDPRRALATIERLLLINPNYAPHVRLRGTLLASVGDQTGAIAELERYLMLVPDAEDFDAIKEQIRSIHLNRARLN